MKKLVLILIAVLFLAGCSAKQSEQSAQNSALTGAPASEEKSNVSEPPVQTMHEENLESLDPEPSETLAADRSEITTPVLVKGYFTGGLYRGEWLGYEDFYNSNAVEFEGYIYNIYLDGAYKGKATGGLPIDPMFGETDPASLSLVELYDENNQKLGYNMYDIAIRADWELYPRAFSMETSNSETYLSLVKEVLAGEGIENPDTVLQQVISVDLDGDGENEVLLTADNTTDGRFEEVKKGDNAVFLYMESDSAEPQVVEKDVYPEEPAEVSLYRLLYRVETIADLDGDGIMEVVMKGRYYEGDWFAIYKLIDGHLETVAQNGRGV